MSSNPPNLLRSFAFRLSLWYAADLHHQHRGAAGAGLLSGRASSFSGKDQEIILAKFKEYAALYQAGGANALAATASQENNPADEKSFYVNLISPTFVPPDHPAG